MSESGTSGLRLAAARRCLLAVSVLHDIDLSLEPDADSAGLPSVVLDGTPPIRVPGLRLAALLADADLEASSTVERVARWLKLRSSVAAIPVPLLLESVRVVGLPAGHELHPGSAWVRSRIPGGALDLGFGLLPVPSDRIESDTSDPLGELGPPVLTPRPVPLPTEILEDALAGTGVSADSLWAPAVRRLDHLVDLAVARLRRRPQDPLRPLAEADVVTLLGCRRFRAELAGDPASGTGTGLAGLIVPMLARGWVSTLAVDPAFGPAAAAAVDGDQRGFARPLLVSAHEVVQVPPGGNPLRHLGIQRQAEPPGTR
jgi:hypothetical protein